MPAAKQLRFVVAGLLFLLAGCASQAGSSQAPTGPASSVTPTTSTTASSPSPAPTESPSPTATILAGDDPSVLLAPGGDMSRLNTKVWADLMKLNSVHVEERIKSTSDASLSFNSSYQGRCSGEMTLKGRTYRFVTTSDERLLVTPVSGGNGTWVAVASSVLPQYCSGGPLDVVLQTSPGGGEQVLEYHAKRIGPATVAGQPAVHFRQKNNGIVIDSWLARDGTDIRVLKVAWAYSGGDVVTMRFSEFDSAPAIEPEPPASQIVTPGS